MMGPAKLRRLRPVGVGVSIRFGAAVASALCNLERMLRRPVRTHRKYVRMFGRRHVVRVIEVKR